MLQKEFFDKIESHFTLKLPFVAYRKPNDSTVKAMMQSDMKLHTVSDFNESGFIFAPFNSEKQTILFPLSSCEILDYQESNGIKNHKPSSRFMIAEIEDNNHIALVQKGIDAITKGEFQKVVLSRVQTVPISEDSPISTFKSLLKSYTNAFVYIWYHPQVGLWLGATPETLLKVEGKRFQTMSLAGTQAYDDSKVAEWNQKNVEEQQLVTDYIEAELSPFTDRLKIAAPLTVRAGELLHLKSKISGVLKKQALKQIIECLHPTPAVCGLPKSKARHFILENEYHDRQFYTGFLGELNIKVSQSRNANKRNVENNAYSTVKATSHLFVNLRCMQMEENKVLIYVGGGITKDSNSKEEWEETVNKAQTMLNVLSS